MAGEGRGKPRRDPKEARRALFARPSRRIGAFAITQPHLAGKATTAALRKVRDTPKRGKEGNSYDASWQTRAYELASSEGGVGEIGYLFNLSANAGAESDLVVEEWLIPGASEEDPEPIGEWRPSKDRRAARVMAAFVGPRGGQAELKRRALLHLSIGGESHLVGTQAVTDAGVPSGIFWEFLSTEELRMDRAGTYTRRRDGSTQEKLSEDTYVARLWRSDPGLSDRADSPMRRVLAIAAEVVVLTQMIEGVARSRLAAGIFFVPTEMSFAPEDDEDTDAGDGDHEGDDGIDDLTGTLLRHLSAPITDRTSAAGLVPLVIRGPAEMSDKIRLIDIARALDTWGQELRKEAIGRLATGLDAPPEILTGKGGLSHWLGANIDSDFIIKHVAPPSSLLADFLTHSYLRPMLEEFEEMDPEEAGRFRVRSDPSKLLSRADEALTARVLHDKTLISDHALVLTSGFDPGDAPSAEETRRRVALELVRINPGVFAKALLPWIPGFEDIDVELLGIDQGGGRAGGTPGQAPPVPTTSLPVDGGEAPVRSGLGAALLDRLAVAADSALERALERAGIRVISAAGSNGKVNDPTIRDRLAAVRDQAEALTLIRPEELRALGFTPAKLLEGAWDRLGGNVIAWIVTHLEGCGIDSATAHDRGVVAVMALREELDAYATAHLHRRPPRFGNGLRVPPELIARSLTAAGALL